MRTTEKLLVASGTRHKIDRITAALQGVVHEVAGTMFPGRLDSLEEQIRYATDRITTARSIPAAKVAALRERSARYSVGIDVLMQSSGRFWHKPGSVDRVRGEVERNLTEVVARSGRIFQRVIPILALTNLAFIDHEFNLGFIAQEAVWFLFQPFTTEESRVYTDLYASLASRSNGGFLIQTPEIQDRVIAIADEQNKSWKSPEERGEDLKQLLLGCPTNMRPLFSHLMLQSYIDQHAQSLPRFQQTEELLHQSELRKRYKLAQLNQWSIIPR